MDKCTPALYELSYLFLAWARNPGGAGVLYVHGNICVFVENLVPGKFVLGTTEKSESVFVSEYITIPFRIAQCRQTSCKVII